MTKSMKIKGVSSKSQSQPGTLARRLAPEEIRAGMHVMVLTQVHECARWSGEFGTGITVSLLNTTPCSGQRPSRVVGVCLPYVLVKTGKGEPYCYDVRTVRLARVGSSFARGFKAIDTAREQKKHRKGKEKQSTKKAKHKKRNKRDRHRKRRKR